jgi:hypothetical protein
VQIMMKGGECDEVIFMKQNTGVMTTL